MKKKYKVEVDCANCANKAECAAAKVAGVKTAAVNFMAQKIQLELEEGVDEKAVLKQIRKACKKIDDDFEIYG